MSNLIEIIFDFKLIHYYLAKTPFNYLKCYFMPVNVELFIKLDVDREMAKRSRKKLPFMTVIGIGL